MTRCRVTEETNEYLRNQESLDVSEAEEVYIETMTKEEIDQRIDSEDDQYLDVIMDEVAPHLCQFYRSMPTTLIKYEDMEQEDIKKAYEAAKEILEQMQELVEPMAKKFVEENY